MFRYPYGEPSHGAILVARHGLEGAPRGYRPVTEDEEASHTSDRPGVGTRDAGMSTDCRRHRLDGLEPGNLLAFLALLGLLRALEEAAPACLPKVAWSVDKPPVRPLLSLSAPVSVATIAATVATGVTRLAES